jgi:hypothetical protein
MSSAPAPHRDDSVEERNRKETPMVYHIKKYTRAFTHITVWQFQTAQTIQTESCVARFTFSFYL